MLRAQPDRSGPVAAEPVVSELVARLAAERPRWYADGYPSRCRPPLGSGPGILAGDASAPGAGGGLVAVDIGAKIVTSCSDKEQATPSWKKSYGNHPLTVFADHGPDGSGEPVAFMLLAGNAGSMTETDHFEATRLGLSQLPSHLRRRSLIRADSRSAAPRTC